MKLKAQLGEVEHSLSIRFDGESVSASVDDRNYELAISELEANRFLLVDGFDVFECRIESTLDMMTVYVRQKDYRIRISDPRRLRSTQSGGRHDHGSVEIIAPMAGKVVRVLVKTGEEVIAGAGILVVEAMKMQNELKTPKNGTVTSIHAEPGATVNAGDILAVIE